MLVEIRNNIKAQVLCAGHYDKLLRKFSFFQVSCSDPYKIHKKGVKGRLSEITMEMWKHDAKFIPGRKICKHCQRKISNEMLEIGSELARCPDGQGGGEGGRGGEEGEGRGVGGEGGHGTEGEDDDLEFWEQGNSQGSHLTTASEHPWSQEYRQADGLSKVNMAFQALELSPLKKCDIGSSSRLEAKLKGVNDIIREHLNIPSAAPNDDSDGFLEALCTRFRSASDRNEKYRCLTSVPSKWSAWKVAKTFSCSYTLAKDAISLRQVFGPGCSPGMKKGHRIPSDVTQKVEDFYKAQDISRELPGQRDCLSVKVGSVREIRQKRLLLLSLREAFAQFKEDFPTCSIGFSTFASLRPREVVLPGSSGTHSVCICTYCHNPTLALTGSGIAYDQAFKDVFGGAPERHLTTKVEH